MSRPNELSDDEVVQGTHFGNEEQGLKGKERGQYYKNMRATCVVSVVGRE